MKKLSSLENHQSSYHALRTLFVGWYAYIETENGIIKGKINISKTGVLRVNGKIIYKNPIKNRIKWYKPVKIESNNQGGVGQ